MSGEGERETPQVYGGRRRTRGLLARTTERAPIDDSAHPTIPDAVRYFPKTGQIPVVPTHEPPIPLGVGNGRAELRLDGASPSPAGAYLVEETEPRTSRPRSMAAPPQAPSQPPTGPTPTHGASEARHAAAPADHTPQRITINGAELARSRAVAPATDPVGPSAAVAPTAAAPAPAPAPAPTTPAGAAAAGEPPLRRRRDARAHRGDDAAATAGATPRREAPASSAPSHSAPQSHDAPRSSGDWQVPSTGPIATSIPKLIEPLREWSSERPHGTQLPQTGPIPVASPSSSPSARVSSAPLGDSPRSASDVSRQAAGAPAPAESRAATGLLTAPPPSTEHPSTSTFILPPPGLAPLADDAPAPIDAPTDPTTSGTPGTEADSRPSSTQSPATPLAQPQPADAVAAATGAAVGTRDGARRSATEDRRDDSARAESRIRNLLGSRALWLGLGGMLVCLFASWIPSFSYDEAVTIEAASRGWGDMWALIGSGYAANAVWMWIVHLWIGAFGYSEVALRLIPALAAGATVAGTTLLAQRLAGPRAALFAGLVAMFLPRLTFDGMDVSSRALATAIATWTMVALVWVVGVDDPIPRFDVPRRLISHRNRARRAAAIWRHVGRWSVVAVLLAAGTWVYAPVVLLVFVLPAFLAVAGARRGALRGSTLASLGAVALTSPLLVTIALQGWRVDWHADGMPRTVWDWIGVPTMTESPFAFPLWVLLALVFIVALVRIRHVVHRVGETGLLLGASWLLMPALALALLQVFAPDTYAPEYLAMTAPALALLVGLAIASARTWIAVVVLVATLLCSVAPGGLQKLPQAKGGSDDRATASYIAANASAGDGIVFSDGSGVGKSGRVMLSTYPHAFTGLNDLGLAQSGEAAGELWDSQVDIASVPTRLEPVDRVWVVRPAELPLSPATPEHEVYATAGFAIISSAEFGEYIVYEVVRTSAYGLDEHGQPPAPDPLPPLPTPIPTAYDDPDR